MAGSYNKVLLMGNLTRDPEVRQAGGGQVCNIGLAVNRRFRTQSGENRDETTFVDCEAWGRTAEVMSQYLSKGRPVFIEGRLKLDQWERDGQKFSKLRVVVESFQFIDSKGEEGSGGGGGGGGRRSSSSYGGGGSGGGGDYGGGYDAPAGVDADDIPF